jgi:hypothetical protein
MNTDHVDLSNMPFVPRFDATSLAKAQNVEADTDNPSSTSVIAQAVELQPQAIVGTVPALRADRNSGHLCPGCTFRLGLRHAHRLDHGCRIPTV